MINEENVELVEAEEETEVESDTETQAQETDTTDWKSKALGYKAILDRNKDKSDKPVSKSNDFDYGAQALLTAKGIADTEYDFVKDEMKSSGIKDIGVLLRNDYFKAKLESHRELTKTQDAIPTGKRSGGVATDSVDYWLAKPFAEVPADKRREVLAAKIVKEKSGSQFYNS